MGPDCCKNHRYIQNLGVVSILFIADPNSIHDIRWISFFSEREEFNCFLIPRKVHCGGIDRTSITLHPRVRILLPIEDPSTIRPFRNLRQIIKLRRVIKRFEIRVLHILYAEPNALWANGKCLLGIPLILTTRGTDVLKTIPGFFQRKDLLGRIVARQYKSALDRFDQITCTSSLQSAAVLSLAKKSSTIVRTGVDFRQLSSEQSNEGILPFDGPFVLMPRAMRPLYNHEFTLEAIALLDDGIRRKYTFVFINSVSNDDAYYQRILERSQSIKTRIVFLQHQKHYKFYRLLKRASLVVMNPTSDGSPATAMEAMACKKPLILPPLDYDLEVFGNAFFFHEWSPGALKLAIETVLKMDEHQLNQRLELNLQAVRSKADFQQEMRKIEVIYQKLISDAVV